VEGRAWTSPLGVVGRGLVALDVEAFDGLRACFVDSARSIKLRIASAMTSLRGGDGTPETPPA
jgi:hypothetical protein